MILNGVNWKEKNLSNTNPIKPRRGEVWNVNLDLTVGPEIQTVCPAVVISSDSIGDLPIKWVLPITVWKDQFSGNIWHIRIKPNDTNGLTKVSAVDTLQLRGMTVKRFISRGGRLNATLINEITAMIAAITEYK